MVSALTGADIGVLECANRTLRAGQLLAAALTLTHGMLHGASVLLPSAARYQQSAASPQLRVPRWVPRWGPVVWFASLALSLFLVPQVALGVLSSWALAMLPLWLVYATQLYCSWATRPALAASAGGANSSAAARSHSGEAASVHTVRRSPPPRRLTARACGSGCAGRMSR